MRIAIPIAGRIAPAVRRPVINHAGIRALMLVTTASPKNRPRATGIRRESSQGISPRRFAFSTPFQSSSQNLRVHSSRPFSAASQLLTHSVLIQFSAEFQGPCQCLALCCLLGMKNKSFHMFFQWDSHPRKPSCPNMINVLHLPVLAANKML